MIEVNERAGGAGHNGGMPIDSRIFELFAARALPNALTEATATLLQALATHALVPRDRIAALGEDSDAFVFVSKGATKLVAHTASGRQQVVGFYFASDLLTVPGEGAHQFCLEALVDSELVHLPYREFRRLAETEPRLLSSLLEASETSLERSRAKAVALGRKTAPERLADFLLGLGLRIGTRQDGTTVLDLPMSRRDIADSLGLTIETVSRQLTLLRDERVIATIGRSCVHLLDLAELQVRSGRFARAA